MAGDWIKMRCDLAEDPSVIGIAAAVGLDEFAVVGRLQFLWAWADRQSRDGHATSVTYAWVDRRVQCDGFAEAMENAGWLQRTDTGVFFPNFERHNGKTAKTRALGTDRKKKQRSDDDPEPQSGRSLSRTERDKSVTREEKRRDINTPPRPPDGGSVPEFDEFVAEFPPSRRIKTEDARAEFSAAVEAGEVTAAEIVAAIRRQAVQQRESWQRDAGRYAPTPVRWLREKRWRDGAEIGGWPDTRSGVEALGERLGLGRWDQAAFDCGQGEAFPAYERRVQQAFDDAGKLGRPSTSGN